MAALTSGIWRTHDDGVKRSEALYSECEQYRYRLRRIWGDGKTLCFVMLNPSTASELKNDPTVERCERRARSLGYAAFEVVNIFALRATDPKALYAHDDPIGPMNDACILEAAKAADRVLMAWGVHGKLNGRADEVRALLSGIQAYHLGLTKAGEPRHPLYVSYAQNLIRADRHP